MAERQYDVASRILTPAEIKQARLELNLSRRVMAELLLLSPGRGHERIKRWEDGDEVISAQSSQCIRLWLAVYDLGPVPPVPFKIGRIGVRYAAMTTADNLRDVLGMDAVDDEDTPGLLRPGSAGAKEALRVLNEYDRWGLDDDDDNPAEGIGEPIY